MNIKKNKTSWFFFAIYVIAYLYVGVCIGNTMSRMLNLGGTALSCIIVVMVILLAFVGCAAALIILVKEKPKNTQAEMRRRRRAQQNDVFFVKEVLPALASYLLVVISRAVFIVRFSGGKLTGHVGLYEQISSGTRVDFDIWSGTERLYAYLLKGFCILLGNVPDAVYILNLICQVILILCCYLFLRMAAGRAAAVASSVLFLCVPYFYHMLIACEPAQLFMALCAAVIVILVLVVKRSVLDFGGKGMLPAYLFCGLVSGMLLTLDLAALLIPAAVIVIFFASVQGRRAEIACFVLGVLLGIPAGMILLNMDVSGTLFSAKTSSYPLTLRAVYDFSRYISSCELALSVPVLFMTLPEDLILLCVIAFGGIAAVLFFWCQHDVLRVIAVPYFGMILFGRLETGFEFSCIGVLTAAMTIGIIYLIGQPVEVAYASVRRKKAEEDKGAESDEVACSQTENGDTAALAKKMKKVRPVKPEKSRKESRTKKEKAVKESKTKKEKTVKEDKAKKEKTVKEDKTKKEKTVEEEITKAEKASSEAEIKTEKTVRFIENPLPLPKKREHREMDYAYEVSEDRMHFDIVVQEQDDFDC